MNSALVQLKAWWQARLPRERVGMVAATAVVALGATLALTDWMLTERHRLEQQLPRAQARLGWMQEASTELAGLRSSPSASPAGPTALVESVQGSARARGFSVTVRQEAGGIQLAGRLPFDAALEWMAELQRDQRLRPVKVEFVRDGGQARMEALLAGPGEP